ncbi:hypothetical protein TWF192_006511 [Orbilia oligospora]|uniref:DUF5745 domain-containing protein n=1 Tax=Orbilia oligospora TaxID=2813651 RepID=A0A6G1M6Y0_ORBOL|nr:hypothetical protein TWF679_011210 [Orbilia oligospora]KAF3247651.1 hypothetical protein TWF192_006511 [Orbilia oligospora]
MPSLVPDSGDNAPSSNHIFWSTTDIPPSSDVILQINAIISGTPLAPVRYLTDITPSLLLDLYELLFHLKLPYATPRDHSPESQLRNIRILIGHIAHDILKMDLSFLEPHKIINGDDKALRDFMRIFLGVTKLRKAYLEKRERYRQQQVAGATSTVRGNSVRWAGGDHGVEEEEEEEEEGGERSVDGSEHTVRATKDSLPNRHHESILKNPVVTPRRTTTAIKRTPSTKASTNDTYTPSVYRPRRVSITENEAPPLPARSETSSIPSNFIQNSNERISNIWSRLNTIGSNGYPSDRSLERLSAHPSRKPLSTIVQDPNLPAYDNRAHNVQTTPSKPRPQPSLAEPGPYLKAWLDTTGTEISTSSHQPRSNQTTPEKRPPNHNILPPLPESPSNDLPTKRPSSSRNPRRTSQRPTFPLRRASSDPTSGALGIDISKAMFSNSPIRISGHAARHHESGSSGEEGGLEDDDTSEIHSPTSSIATSALSVSSVEWSDTASIKELRQKRLEALEDIKIEQEAAMTPVKPQHQQGDDTTTPISDGSRKQIIQGHGRRRSSIPSEFMHNGNNSAGKSTVSYETISPNSSASMWRAKRRDEEMPPMQPVTAEGSPIPKRSLRGLQRYRNDYDDEEDEEGYRAGPDDTFTTRNTADLELELKGLDAQGLSESKRQIMLFERLIRRAVDKKIPGLKEEGRTRRIVGEEGGRQMAK